MTGHWDSYWHGQELGGGKQDFINSDWIAVAGLICIQDALAIFDLSRFFSVLDHDRFSWGQFMDAAVQWQRFFGLGYGDDDFAGRELERSRVGP
jgi:hypothetical protein